ncbi:MAG: hypothetical protein AAF268_16855 [Cyanobacteria bacterium P01_A01_bin.3]
MTKHLPIVAQQTPSGDMDICDRRIVFFTRLAKGVFVLAGVILAITQVVQLILDGQSLSLWLGLVAGIALAWIGWIADLKHSIKRIVLRHSGSDKWMVWCTPLILIGLIVGLRYLVGRETFRAISEEGGVIEYGTSVAFLLAAVFAIPVTKHLWARGNTILGGAYGMFALLLGFVAFEEISWGQRLLGVQSPEFFETNNSQAEITLHNLLWVNELIDPALIAVGLLGAFSWFMLRSLSRSKHGLLRGGYALFVPSWFLSSYFLVVSAVYTCTRYIEPAHYTMSIYGETAELVLSLGFLMLVLSSYFRQCLSHRPYSSDL